MIECRVKPDDANALKIGQTTEIRIAAFHDRRGHGKSGVPPGPYSMERFGRDALAILDDLNIDKVH